MTLRVIYNLGQRLSQLRSSCVLSTIPSMDDLACVRGERNLLHLLYLILIDLKTLHLSPGTQKDVKRLIDYLTNSYVEKENLRDDDTDKILRKQLIWDDRILNALSDKKVIEVFTEGTLNYKTLLMGGKGFFPKEEIWDNLSQISKSDLNDACNCLLTKSWTPAVMVSLRASEHCIRRFYEAKTGNKSGRKGWKKVLDDLDGMPDINKTLIGYLNHIRDMRNTAGHPDKIFDQTEAERVFHLVIDIIIVIDRELRLLKMTEE